MNSIHDMGGCHGMGEISREQNEPFFHETWEARLFACQFAMNACGSWTLDRVRWFREQMPGPLYLNSKYYEIWLDAFIKWEFLFCSSYRGFTVLATLTDFR